MSEALKKPVDTTEAENRLLEEAGLDAEAIQYPVDSIDESAIIDNAEEGLAHYNSGSEGSWLQNRRDIYRHNAEINTTHMEAYDEGFVSNESSKTLYSSVHKKLRAVYGHLKVISSTIAGNKLEGVTHVDEKPEIQNTTENYGDQLDRLRESNMPSFRLFMDNPPEKTDGLSDQEWKEVQAAFDDESNWSPERRELHERILDEAVKQAESLSKRLLERDPTPTIYVLRGTTGAGKTTALRNGNEMFSGILDENGEPTGCIAPDVFKLQLMKEGGSHSQVHDEASVVGRKIMSKLRTRGLSIVFDKLMNYPDNIDEVLSSAQETGKKVKIMDVDVPLELSAVRVLMRAQGGNDPNIPFMGVTSAYAGIKNNRRTLFKQLEQNSELVNGYVLMGFDLESKSSVEVARFEDGKVVVCPGREALSDSTSPTDREQVAAELDYVKNITIDEEFITYFCTTYFEDASSKYAIGAATALREYAGKSLAEALDTKAGVI